uniref:U2A'/phosphoprotein 32 family A C-terminal domain-containing protein n=1 Tax=Chromera velia CCMP2878 TaxID=1169474 RepID=A0A0G4IDX7_9ALVE|eukprot:Cvel_13565.t1-p1 / transcript=Cvel_13565.t1 / gene=Cvel_13565 / organism=Chromera_velia_CCMP2878 / gene_product=Leucine-rich repeat-containing protein 61, putative / transcript_product=Leucine-rich repeat-containing protein 61, putative / location=Cvel_scaffold932:20255-22209(-) / protein_length=436 / sequence_SO=supercontig / SO=protein_coding / is_pseudo=false
MADASADFLLALTAEFDLEALHHVDLKKCKLERLSGVHRLKNCRRINLSSNSLTRMECLPSLTSLNYLDLSFNQINRVDNLNSLISLETLKLKGNPIERLNDLSGLKEAPSLTVLFLQEADRSSPCPVCFNVDYQSTVLSLVKRLTCLDGKRRHLPSLEIPPEAFREPRLPTPEGGPWLGPEHLAALPDCGTEPDRAIGAGLENFSSLKWSFLELFDEGEGLLKTIRSNLFKEPSANKEIQDRGDDVKAIGGETKSLEGGAKLVENTADTRFLRKAEEEKEANAKAQSSSDHVETFSPPSQSNTETEKGEQPHGTTKLGDKTKTSSQNAPPNAEHPENMKMKEKEKEKTSSSSSGTVAARDRKSSLSVSSASASTAASSVPPHANNPNPPTQKEKAGGTRQTRQPRGGAHKEGREGPGGGGSRGPNRGQRASAAPN